MTRGDAVESQEMRFVGQKAIGRLEVAASQEGVDDDKGFEDNLDRRECRQGGETETGTM